MSPLLKRILEEKALRRRRLMALPYPEKVRIVEQMRAASREIEFAVEGGSIVREEPSIYGAKSE